MDVVPASRARCAAVALGLTATLWGAVAVLVGALTTAATAGPSATAEQGLVRLCLGALAAAAGWAWLQAMAGVADAWRGAPARGSRHGVRRLALAACGAALAGGLCAPAHAGTASTGGTGGPDRTHGTETVATKSSRSLSGLPLPERAEGPAHARRRDVVVRTGDTLWALAEHRMPAGSTDRQVTAAWRDLYRRNRDVIGPDPDLLLPGQVLRLTKEKK